MTAQKIYIILCSSILILFCARIAHTAPAKQHDSSEFKVINLCLNSLTPINVASNDTGFILSTTNCTSSFDLGFKFKYGDADANDADVIFGWSSASGAFISTDSKGQITVKEVTAKESYWNPTGDVHYYVPYGHSVTLAVFKGCSKSNVTRKPVNSTQLVSDARKQNFTCEGSKQLVNNMYQFSDAHILSCDLKTRTWDQYDVSCNGPLRCVDLNNNQKPSGCDIWRIHENAGVNVTCSNANSAGEPSFNLTCENRQVLGILGSSFRSEVGSLEVTCKGVRESNSWFTSTNETIPQPSHWGCLDRLDPIMGVAATNSSDNHLPKNDIEKYERKIEEYTVISIVFIVITGIQATTVTVYCIVRKRMLWKKQVKNKSSEVASMGLVNGTSTARPDSGTTYHVLEPVSSPEQKRTDVAGEYASIDMHGQKPTHSGGLYEDVNLDSNDQLQKVAVSAQPEMPSETYASVNKIGKKPRIETQADAESSQ